MPDRQLCFLVNFKCTSGRSRLEILFAKNENLRATEKDSAQSNLGKKSRRRSTLKNTREHAARFKGNLSRAIREFLAAPRFSEMKKIPRDITRITLTSSIIGQALAGRERRGDLDRSPFRIFQ